MEYGSTFLEVGKAVFCLFYTHHMLLKFCRNIVTLLFSVVFVNSENVAFQIPLARYLPTWRGNVIDAQLEMNPSRIVGMSLSVNAEGGMPGSRSGPGDFRVEIDWIKALRAQ